MQHSNRQVASLCLLMLVIMQKHLVTHHGLVCEGLGRKIGKRVIRITDAWWSHAEIDVTVAVSSATAEI